MGRGMGFALAGIAKGLGEGMVLSAQDRERQALEQQRQDALMQRSREGNDTKMEIAQLRAEMAGSRAGGGRGGIPLSELAGLTDEQIERLQGFGGLSREDAVAARGVRTGGVPEETQQLDPGRFTDPSKYGDNAGVGGKVTQAKYTEGQAKDLMERSFITLRRAIGLTSPGVADDIAKAEGTERTGRLVDQYAGGNNRAGDAALVNQGKDPSIGDAKQTAADAAMKKAGAAAAGGGASSANKVQSTRTDADGNILAIMKDGTTRILGKGKDYQTMVQSEKKNLAKTIEGASLSDAQLEAKAVGNLAGRAPKAVNAPANVAEKSTTTVVAPPSNLLKEGIQTKFKNGQVWTLRGGKPERVN